MLEFAEGLRSIGQFYYSGSAGGTIAPDLTGSGRKKADYVLSNLIDPSAQIDPAYRLILVELPEPWRRLVCILAAQYRQCVTAIERPAAARQMPARESLASRLPNLNAMNLTKAGLEPRSRCRVAATPSPGIADAYSVYRQRRQFVEFWFT